MQRIPSLSASLSLLTMLVTEGKTPDHRNVINQIYEKARASVNQVENSAAVLAAMVTDFDKLIGSGNLRSSHLPVLLQEALIVFIMCNKEAGYFLISPQEILSALDALIAQLPEEHANALRQYKNVDLSALLEIGIRLYNQHQPGSPPRICFGEDFWQSVPPEVQSYQCLFLPLHDQLNFSSTCTAQNDRYWRDHINAAGTLLITPQCSARKLFLENPKYRLDCYIPIDQIGIDYLQKELGVNCGPLTIQKIKKGELTIEQAKDETTEEKIAQFLEGIKEQLGEMARDYSRFDADLDWSQQNLNPIVKYMIDGSLNLDLLKKVDSGYFLILSSDPAVQKYLDNGKIKIEDFDYRYRDYTDRIEELLSALNNSTVQTYIDNGKLTPHKSGHTESWNFIRFYDALSSHGLQKYLQNGQVTLERIIQVVNFLKYHHYIFLLLIENSSIQRCIDSNQLTVEQFIDLCVKKHEFNDGMFENLPGHLEHCKGITKYLENGKLTVKSFINDPEIHILGEILDMQGIQEHIDNNTLTIKQFAYLPGVRDFAKALDNLEIKELLRKNIITMNELTDVVNIRDFVKVVEEVKRNKSLESDNLCLLAQSFIKMPDISAFKNVISHRYVKLAITFSELSYLELIKIPNVTELFHALRNKKVNKFLFNMQLTIQQLINLPNISAFVNALNHPQVREKLKQGTLTIGELIHSPIINELRDDLLAESCLSHFNPDFPKK